MARTFIRQDIQIRKSDVYTDTTVPSQANYETSPVNIEDDLNSLRSITNHLGTVGTGNWYNPIPTPSTFESGAQRGVHAVNQDLHDLERKRVLVSLSSLVDISVPAAQNWIALTLAQLPSVTTAAIGAVTTLGTVAAYTATYGMHSLSEVSGSTAISPKNLCAIVDGASRDPILSSGRVVYGLFQTESSTDGSTLTGTTPNRAQISFVRINAAGDDLEAVPSADITGKVINYASIVRKALEDLTEQDFLKGAEVDVPSSATVTRQVAYDNQGATPVNATTNSVLDLEGPGIYWEIRDDLEAGLFRITEGSAGGTSTVAISTDVDTFDVNSVVNDFAAGLRVATSGQRINIGETAGVVESTGSNDLRILGAGELLLDDGNQAGSTWAQTNGIKLSDTTTEWDQFETRFGEVSLLQAIYAAGQSNRGAKVYSNVTSTTTANTDVGGTGGGANLDTQLPNMSTGTFLADYDLFLNGELLRPGADASANHDYYPGTSLALGQVKFEFVVKIGDVLCVVPYA